MKIKLPENQSEITLEQYQRYVKLMQRDDLDIYGHNRRLLEIFTPLRYKETENISQIDFEFCINQINKALNEEVKFSPRFELAGVEFGFVDNLNNISSLELELIEKFDKITIGEFIDADTYSNNIDELHNLMSVLFRPIINKDAFGNYKIAPYNGTQAYSNLMKSMPLNVVNGSLFFFLNLSTELESYILKYTRAVQKRAMHL